METMTPPRPRPHCSTSAPAGRTLTARRPLPRLLIGVFAMLLALALAMFAPAAAWGATGAAGPGTQTIGDTDGPAFGAGQAVNVTGTVNGDLYVAGQTVHVTGTVRGDILGAAQTIDITGTVNGDVRAAGQSVDVAGRVDGSVTLAGADVTIGPDATVGRDAVLAGSTVTIEGSVGRDVTAAGRLSLSGSIGRDLAYTSDRQLTRSNGATVGGRTEFHRSQSAQRAQPTAGQRFGWWLLGTLYAMAALLAIVILSTLLAPTALARAGSIAWHRIGWSALAGLVLMVAIPAAAFAAAATVIGLPVAVLLGLGALLLAVAGLVVSAHLIGRLVLRRSNPYLQALVGAPLLALGLAVPFLGVFVMIAAQLVGVGAIVLGYWERRRAVPPTPGPGPDESQPETVDAPTATPPPAPSG
ncbi:MAG: polymer-forming cytoskeletal protein [Pseudoclavibacter sp.]